MPHNQKGSILKITSDDQKRLTKDREDKENKKFLDLSKTEFISVQKKVYDSGWTTATLVDIEGAYTQTENYELPQKANYSFTTQFGINENYLPHLRPEIIIKSHPTQKTEGVGQYIFSFLREISFRIYEWQGITELTLPSSNETHGLSVTTDDEGGAVVPANPSLGSGDYEGGYPQPSSAYTVYYEFTNTFVGVGSGITTELSADGSQVVISPTETVNFAGWLAGLHSIWGDFNYNVFTTRKVAFVPDQTLPFPNESETEYNFPSGTTDDPDTHSTAEYPTQYYLQEDVVDFIGLVNEFGSYDSAKSIVEQYYENILITDEDDPPWKAYETVEEDTVVASTRHIDIRKLSDDLYEFEINGDVLVVSKANTETDFSDEDFPTYTPVGEDLQLKCVIYYDSIINYKTLEGFQK